MIVKPAAMPGICGPTHVSAAAAITTTNSGHSRLTIVDPGRMSGIIVPALASASSRAIGGLTSLRRPSHVADERRDDPPAGRVQGDRVVLVARGGDEREDRERRRRAPAEQDRGAQEVDEAHYSARQDLEHGPHAERAVDQQVGGLLQLGRRLVARRHADADRARAACRRRPRRAARRTRRGRCGRRRRTCATSRPGVSLSSVLTPSPLFSSTGGRTSRILRPQCVTKPVGLGAGGQGPGPRPRRRPRRARRASGSRR